jgi:hypothetical protein
MYIAGLEPGQRTNAHLPVTSVTREKIDSESARRYNDNTEKSKNYYQVLTNQQEESNRNKKLAKLKDDVAGMEHNKKWDQMVNKFFYCVLNTPY